MPAFREDLLRPSLSNPGAVAVAPYSNEAVFFISFFGGPIAAIAIFAMNARRLGRQRSDLPWLVAAAICGMAAIAWMASPSWAANVRPLLSAWLGGSADRIAMRLAGLLIAALALLRHRREQRSADLMGLPRPGAWKPGLALVALGVGAGFLLSRAFA